jgi:murein DD-endopeptidase MepM/ murein hydrolase activator NlpD
LRINLINNIFSRFTLYQVALFIFLALFFHFPAQLKASTIYKYKDESGKWVFSDKPPLDKNKSVDTIEHKEKEKKKIGPNVWRHQQDNSYLIVANNPLHAPIEVGILFNENKRISHRKVIPPKQTAILLKSKTEIEPFRYRWALGDSNSRVVNYTYKVPVSSKKEYRISQSFNGIFSHSKEPNIHAVDIAMQVGTYISAAREGVVVMIKEDYYMGGRNNYFLDKANYILVMHDDGTYATYAHILNDSAQVSVGEKVKAGQRLARSGSSGFSTGPHLHFVIRKNVGFQTISLPFSFEDENGGTFRPQRGMMLKGPPSSNDQ